MRVRTVVFGSIFTLAACSPEPIDLNPTPKDTDNGGIDRPLDVEPESTPVDTAPEVIDTAVDPTDLDTIDPALLLLMATFGYDATTGEAVPYTFGLNTYAPRLTVIVAAADWSGSFSEVEKYCQVRRDFTERSPRSSQLDTFPEVVYAFDVPDNTINTPECEGRLDPFWGDIDQAVVDWDWTVAVEAQIDPSYQELLVQAGWTPEMLSEFVGGGFGGTLGGFLSPDGYFPIAITQGSMMDENYNLVLDNTGAPTPLFADEMVVNGELVTGYYYSQIALDWAAVSPYFIGP